MDLTLIRYSDNGDDTTGLMFIDGKFFGHTLEDEFRSVKIAGETRIPAGEYPVDFRKEESPKTKKYRGLYPGLFEWHLMLKDVPNFSYVYIHRGNDDDHTEGCILVGDSVNNNTIGEGKIGYSANSFGRFYKKVARALMSGEKVKIKIVDFDKGIKL